MASCVDEPSRCAAKFELRDVVIDHGIQVRLLDRREGLDRLQDFNRQSLSIFNSLLVESIGSIRGGNPIACHFQTPFSLNNLCMGFNDFPRDTVESMARRMAVPDHALEKFRVIDGLSHEERLKAGERVKIVVE